MAAKSRKLHNGLAVLAALVFVAGLVGWYKLARDVDQHFDSEREWYLYGSIGNENEEGLPYWIWMSLPELFPQHLPREGGYESVGLVWEDGRDTPVGFSKKTIGFDRIGINCAVCHSTTYRLHAEDELHVVPGGPSQRFDLQAYLKFLAACGNDPGFTAERILPAVAARTELSWLDKMLYRFLLIPLTRKGLQEQSERFAWMDSRPRWGPGRIDPFNPVKFQQLGIAEDQTIGNSDMQALWRMGRRGGHSLHWDGLNDSLTEVVQSGAIGDGATHKSLPIARLQKLQAYISDLNPPAYPYKAGLDRKKMHRGEKVFERLCADCHGHGGARTGDVIPIAEVGTDPQRIQMWTQEAADAYNAYDASLFWSIVSWFKYGSSVQFAAFSNNEGYVAEPLDGLWLRAPYLHNGSVATVEELLLPQAQRSTGFFRGYDVYDDTRLGFESTGPDAEMRGFLVDTNVVGNSNQGHEGDAYGTALSANDKADLIEYLKSL